MYLLAMDTDASGGQSVKRLDFHTCEMKKPGGSSCRPCLIQLHKRENYFPLCVELHSSISIESP
jgi:hypothetical protein